MSDQYLVEREKLKQLYEEAHAAGMPLHEYIKFVKVVSNFGFIVVFLFSLWGFIYPITLENGGQESPFNLFFKLIGFNDINDWIVIYLFIVPLLGLGWKFRFFVGVLILKIPVIIYDLIKAPFKNR